MDIEELRQNLLDTIKDAIPQDKNMAYILADILCLGREAVYRRLRGEVPFSFYEIATISEKLNISIDHIMGNSIPNSAVFHMYKNEYLTPSKTHYESLKNSLQNYRNVVSGNNSELGYSGNTIPACFTMKYKAHTRLKTLKWMYQRKKMESLRSFDKIKIPDDLLLLHQEYGQLQSEVKNSYYTLDSNLFTYLVNDINYFQGIQLLSPEDVKELKEETLILLEEMESIAVRGRFENGNKVQLYISSLNFDTNYTYIKSSKQHMSMVHTFVLSCITSYDKNVLEDLKNLIKSQQRFSTLISETGEAQRVEFFKKQIKMVEAI